MGNKARRPIEADAPIVMKPARPKIDMAVIPARGGSKGVSRKNVRMLAGKPLLAYTIEAALHSRCFDRTIVSTDDREIASLAVRYGAEVPFLRPASLATDSASSYDVARHAVSQLEATGARVKSVCLLQPTSPLRTAEDIRKAMKCFRSKSASVVVSVTCSSESPYWMFTRDKNHRLRPVVEKKGQWTTPRQKLEPVFHLNGAIYLMKRETAMRDSPSPMEGKVYGIEIPKKRSIDIDTHADFHLANILLRHGRVNQTIPPDTS